MPAASKILASLFNAIPQCSALASTGRIARRGSIALGCCLVSSFLSAVVAEETQVRRVRITDRLPYGQKPIDYLGHDADDAIARLKKRMAVGEVTLRYESKHGYLRSLLEELNISVTSQVLVYSKTAVNQRLIGPKRPRAIYFNDDVSVAWVPGAAELELSAIDPQKGGMFYVLPQKPGLESKNASARLKREDRCLACHIGQTTMQVPGFIVRSFQTDETGKPVVGYSRVTHQTAISKRWGGWYVTGTHGKQSHNGNLVSQADNERHKREPSFGGNVTDLRPYFEVADYASPHSDIVAHLVLEHQSHGQNLIFRVNYESRLNRRSDAEDQLLRYLLFVDESPLKGPFKGTSGFAEWFEKQGPNHAKGRSLRQFDLQSRLFKHRLSYLVYSRAIDQLPADVKSRLYRELWQVLTGKHPSPDFQRIAERERTAILDILRTTKKNLPRYWSK